MAKWADQEKKPEEPKGDFLEYHKEVNYIYGGPDSYESRRKQKLIAREVTVVSTVTPEYLKCYEVPITFDCSDHPEFVPKSGRYPLIVSLIVKDVKPNRVLINGGSSLNIMFLKTINQMGLSRSLLCPQLGLLLWHSPWRSSDPCRSDHSSHNLQNSGKFPHREFTVQGC
jgi:hypothetical protein